MSRDGPEPPPGITERIVERIRASGDLGLTAAQLARSTGALPGEVGDALEALRRDRKVTRVGHGLWLDPRLLSDPARDGGVAPPDRYLEEFRRAHGLALGTYAGDIQFRPNTEEAVHRWWPYVQGFSAGFVRDALQRYGAGRGATVLDPFAGSGTVPVVARRAGAAGLGTELMPISAFVAAAKQRWSVDPGRLRSAAAAVVSRARSGPLAPLPFLRETRRQFDAGPLEALRRLRAALDDGGYPPAVADLLRLAFARILVDASRMRRSPCLGYGPKARVAADAPYRFFREAVERCAEDLVGLRASRGAWGPTARIVPADSRQYAWPRGSVDLAVTSPPYVNGMDYVMNYKLELAWLGFVDSYDDLRALKDRMVACDNLPRTSARRGLGDAALSEDPWIEGILAAMRRNLRAKTSYRRDDMDAIVLSYFADLRPVISQVFDALRPGGRFVVVNGDSFLAGVHVPGDLVFARLATEAGFAVERFEIARVRRSGQRRDVRLRESILTLRRPPA